MTVDAVTGATSTLSTLNGSLDTAKGFEWIGDTLYIAEGENGIITTPILATVDPLTGNVTPVAGGPTLSPALGAIAAPRRSAVGID